MIWFGLLAVTLIVLAPVGWAIVRPATSQDRREMALSLYRAQLAELDRELAEGRLLATEVSAARLEVQRRMLAVAADDAPRVVRASRWPLIYAVTLVPAAALGLYLLSHGEPSLPAQPLRPRLREWAREDRLIALLQTRLASLPRSDPRAYQGYLLLADAEARRDRLAQASDAWLQALAIHEDWSVAVRAAEARVEAQGTVDPTAAALFRRVLADKNADPEWRALAAQRLKEAGF